MLEQYLVEQCAPTLASLKLGSMFALTVPEGAELEQEVEELNRGFERKGLLITVLRRRGERATVYLCRVSQLSRELGKPDVAAFLNKCGYCDLSLQAVLARLRGRFDETSSIPHEIGVFLGYPLGDVIGFIANRGRSSIRTGYWQVYCDEAGAAEKFARYRKCHELYSRLFHAGKSIGELAVTA